MRSNSIFTNEPQISRFSTDKSPGHERGGGSTLNIMNRRL